MHVRGTPLRIEMAHELRVAGPLAPMRIERLFEPNSYRHLIVSLHQGGPRQIPDQSVQSTFSRTFPDDPHGRAKTRFHFVNPGRALLERKQAARVRQAKGTSRSS